MSEVYGLESHGVNPCASNALAQGVPVIFQTNSADRPFSRFCHSVRARLTPVLLCFVVVATHAVAASPPSAIETASLTFEESVRRAVSNNPALQGARANVVAAEQRVRAARSGFLPQIAGSVTYSDSSGSGTTVPSDYSSAITATQNLFAGFQDQARVAQGSAQFDIAQAGLALAKATLSRDLKTAFAGLMYAQDNVALSETILRRLQDNLRMVELRFEGGTENKGSLLLTRASLAQARLDRAQAEQTLVAARAELARALGDASAEWHAVPAVAMAPPPPAPDFSALMLATPALRDAIARQQLAEADVRLARSGFYPSVDLRGSVGRDGDQWFPPNDRNSISATVSIPIFSGGRDYYSVRSALASVDAAKAGREGVEYQLLARLKQTYAAYVAAVEQLQVNREFLAAAQTRAQIARARYQTGLVSFEEWDRIESDLTQRQKAWLAVQRDRIAAEAEWELAQGTGVIS